MENKIKLFLPNGGPVIRQMKLVHGGEKAQLFAVHVLSPRPRK